MFSKKAFTLVELMIVIAIIGILAAALFPSLTGYLARSRDTVRISDINRLGSTLRIYDADNGYMPSTTLYSGSDQGGWDFSSQPAGSPTFVKFLVDGGYMQKMLRDPLNNFDSHTCDIGWGQTNCPGFAYFYFCYQTGFDYPQFVIGARLERSPSGQIANSLGYIAGDDGVTYYFGTHNQNKNINGVSQCK